MVKHEDIYKQHGFETMSIFTSPWNLSSPKHGETEGQRIAAVLDVGRTWCGSVR